MSKISELIIEVCEEFEAGLSIKEITKRHNIRSDDGKFNYAFVQEIIRLYYRAGTKSQRES